MSRHVRTVRSAARARNRPRKALAWFLVGVLSALLALAGHALADGTSDLSGATRVAAGDVGDSADGDFDGTEVDDVLDAIDDESELARSPLDAGAVLTEGSLAATSGLYDAASLHEMQARHRGPSPWGRFDLSVAWRRIDRADEPRREEIVVVATWRH